MPLAKPITLWPLTRIAFGSADVFQQDSGEDWHRGKQQAREAASMPDVRTVLTTRATRKESDGLLDEISAGSCATDMVLRQPAEVVLRVLSTLAQDMRTMCAHDAQNRMPSCFFRRNAISYA